MQTTTVIRGQIISLLVGISLITPLLGQRLEKGMSYEQRIELAHGVLDPIRDIAADTENFRQRYPYFLNIYAALDPVWTARFILDHPTPDQEALYDLSAIQALARQADRLGTDELMRLIDAAKFMRANVALQAVQSLSPEKENLREQIIEYGLSKQDSDIPESPMSFDSRVELAALSKDPQRVVAVKEQIGAFYTSGKADALKEQAPDNQQSFIEAMLERFAPNSHKAPFQPSETNAYKLEQSILSNESLTDSQKLEKLHQIKDYSFGVQQHEVTSAASLLGRIALLDHELALKWAEQAPDPASKAWAKLTIAPSVNRLDAEAGKQLIRQSYEELSKLQISDYQQSVWLYIPPSVVACNGLFIVHATHPELVQECLPTTVELVERFNISTSASNYFVAIAAIAPFDSQMARSMYDKASTDVSIGDAAGFFKALLAVEPESFLREYQSMPVKDRGGNDPRLQVRGHVLPPLIMRTQEEFWRTLAQSSFLQIPEGILVEPQ